MKRFPRIKTLTSSTNCSGGFSPGYTGLRLLPLLLCLFLSLLRGVA